MGVPALFGYQSNWEGFSLCSLKVVSVVQIWWASLWEDPIESFSAANVVVTSPSCVPLYLVQIESMPDTTLYPCHRAYRASLPMQALHSHIPIAAGCRVLPQAFASLARRSPSCMCSHSPLLHMRGFHNLCRAELMGSSYNTLAGHAPLDEASGFGYTDV